MWGAGNSVVYPWWKEHRTMLQEAGFCSQRTHFTLVLGSVTSIVKTGVVSVELCSPNCVLLKP